VQNSRGDWGTTANTKKTNICGRDFYYWPYVDGFPGYSYLWARGPYKSVETECYDDDTCYTPANSAAADDWYQPGVARRGTYAASLWSPFYLESVIADNAIPADEKGPLDPDDARATIDGLVSDMYAGGIDASGGTPWKSGVGNVDFYVNIGPNQEIIPDPATFYNTNAAFQHYSVASYLTFLQSRGDADLCKPTAVVYITDGQPEPWDEQGGSDLYSRLSKIRRKLGVKSYIAGFSQGFENNQVAWDRLQGMACAAAGSTNYNAPCSFNNVAYGWDTCADKTNPDEGCAWMADNSDELASQLVQIIAGIIRNDVPGGPGMATAEFIPSNNPNDPAEALQTVLGTHTDTAGFKGHVTRQACNTEDPNTPGQLASWCANVATTPLETDEEESFGPCPLSRVWDAGECLKLTDWTDRRIYSHDANKQLFRIADANGNATAQFKNLVISLNSQGKISPPLSANVNTQAAEIQAMVEFLHGKNMPDDWKLAGVPYTSPIVVRRIPKANESFQPSVGIKDPHCAGRRKAAGDEVPETLKTFANNSWNITQGAGLGKHYEYTEAVLTGSDMGMIHAFHYDSGNELFALLPMAMISHARKLSMNGVSNFGQSPNIDEHVYGIAATANVAWVFDHDKQIWRHLAVMGLGAGGREVLAFDVSHMGRLAQDNPIDLLWVTSLTDIADEYDDSLGQTWSRPSLSYMVPGDDIANEPYAYLVFGSGYREGQGAAHRGRSVWLVDAITGGEFYNDTAFFQAPPDQRYYDTADDFATINDAAIATHCLSGFWAEMQEAYIADPAGRLFRWDIAPDTNNPWVFPQTATSGGKWAAGGNGLAIGEELFRFPACQGTDEFNCTVAAVAQNGNRGDLFVFSPAIAAKNKLDPPNADGSVLSLTDRDQFLVALISGSPNDDKTDGGDPNNDFHSSLYLMADDHRSPNQEAGLTIPGIGDKTAPGTNATFMRMALSDITRTRTIEYPDGTTEEETREFSKAARPLRSPLVRITGAFAQDGVTELPIEVFYITYTIYEPGEQTCDPRWYDKDKEEWVFDYGATYELTFRLVAEDGNPFNFLNNYALPGNSDGFGTNGKLTGPVIEQIGDRGMAQRAPMTNPCDPNTGGQSSPTGPTAVQVGWSELEGFSPLEIDM
jgi:hypothetical protein